MEWNHIITQKEVEELNELFENFHDCCLKELVLPYLLVFDHFHIN